MFQTIDVVIVRTKNGLEVKILDGHHRTHMALRQYPKPEDMPEDFTFFIRNVTSNSLTGLEIDPETVDQPPTLTPFQYGEVLILPTQEQPEVATERMSGHFIDMWDMALGKETREKMPLLLALGLQSEDSRNQDNNFGLGERVQLNDDEKKTIFASLDEMRGVANKMHLPLQRIMAETIRLLVKNHGRDTSQAKKHLRGIFDIPHIHEKFSEKGTKDNLVNVFWSNIRDRLRVEKSKPGAKLRTLIYIEDVLAHLNNDAFPPSRTRDVIAATDPSERAEKIRKELEFKERKEAYAEVTGKNDLNGIEERLLKNTSHLTLKRINEIATTIANASEFLRERPEEFSINELYDTVMLGTKHSARYKREDWNRKVTTLQKALDRASSEGSTSGRTEVVYERGVGPRELALRRIISRLERQLEGVRATLAEERRVIVGLRSENVELQREIGRLRGKQSE